MREFNPSYLDEKKTITREQIEQFKHQNLRLNKEISDSLSIAGREVIQDGVFDYEGYLRSKVKILWLMKEPYDTAGGGWHISELYKKEFGPDRTTWYPIINVSHSILDGFQPITPAKRMRKGNADLKRVLLHIAYINVQKLPSVTREKTDNAIIHSAFRDEKQKSFFSRQFRLLNPDIIIGANTLWMMFEHFDLKGNGLTLKPTEDSYVVNGRLFVNAKHPANRGNKTSYLENIMHAARGWYDHIASPTVVNL